MQIVQPNEVTTLLLDPAYMPFGTATARGAFYAILGGKGSGIDANGSPYKWDQYVSKNISIWQNQPVMRSGFNAAYSSNIWVIPTIVVVNSKFFFKRKKKEDSNVLPSLREVYDFYKGICSFCHSRVSFSEASREHISPQCVYKNNHYTNITLACRSCNSRAGHQMPKLDIHGNEIHGKMRVKPSHFQLPSSVKAREEWAPYLFNS
jgi:uncharacterized phage-associated protein